MNFVSLADRFRLQEAVLHMACCLTFYKRDFHDNVLSSDGFTPTAFEVQIRQALVAYASLHTERFSALAAKYSSIVADFDAGIKQTYADLYVKFLPWDDGNLPFSLTVDPRRKPALKRKGGSEKVKASHVTKKVRKE